MDQKQKSNDIEKPPFFTTWKGMYGLVAGVLVVLIIIFYWLMTYFS